MNYNVLDISDLHLGHRKVSVDDIIASLRAIVYPLLHDIHMLLFPGDFFDTLLTLNSEVAVKAIMLMQELIQLAEQHKFIIRVVRGTYSHDRNQNNFWEIVSKDTNVVRVFNSITIETVLGLNICYIPDGSPHDTMDIIRQKLKELSIDKLDIVVGHGQFEHNLPHGAIVHDTIFRVDDFKDIVKGFIAFGHIHTFSVYKNCIYSGSYSRGNHGEEEDKGCVLIQYDSNTGKMRYKFIVNTYSLLFKTVDLSFLTDQEEILNRFISTIDGLITDKRMYIRIIHDDPIVRDSLKGVCKRKYPNIVLSFKKTKELNVISNVTTSNVSNLEIITEDNIYDIISTFINNKLSVDEVRQLMDAV